MLNEKERKKLLETKYILQGILSEESEEVQDNVKKAVKDITALHEYHLTLHGKDVCFMANSLAQIDITLKGLGE